MIRHKYNWNDLFDADYNQALARKFQLFKPIKHRGNTTCHQAEAISEVISEIEREDYAIDGQAEYITKQEGISIS